MQWAQEHRIPAMQISHAQLCLHWACQFCLCLQTSALELKINDDRKICQQRNEGAMAYSLQCMHTQRCGNSQIRFQMVQTLSACRPGSALPILSKIALSLDIRRRKATPRLFISTWSGFWVIHSFMIVTNPNLRRNNNQVGRSGSAA